MKLLVADGLRHARLGGYGCLSRNLVLGLERRGHDVALVQRASEADWEPIERGARERLEHIPVEREAWADLVLQIGSPAACQEFGPPSLIYTQNALGELRKDWVEALRQADGAIVPSEFDRRVFERHLDRVYVARQSSDPRVFRPQAARRSEGSDRFTFCFVGSYGFRKGVDLLLEAFLNEFGPSDDVELRLHCAGAGGGGEFDHLMEIVERVNPLGRVRLSGRRQSPHWMCRAYNRCDAFVTLTRGEGWCMPVTEALLCELPVICPDSTAMGEYLSPEVAHLIPTHRKSIASITDRFGASFAEVYGGGGNVLYEPDVYAAQEAMREVCTDYPMAKMGALAGARLIREEVTWDAAVEDVERACADLLQLPASGLAPAGSRNEP